MNFKKNSQPTIKTKIKTNRNTKSVAAIILPLALTLIAMSACGKPRAQKISDASSEPLLTSDNRSQASQDTGPTQEESDLLQQLRTPDEPETLADSSPSGPLEHKVPTKPILNPLPNPQDWNEPLMSDSSEPDPLPPKAATPAPKQETPSKDKKSEKPKEKSKESTQPKKTPAPKPQLAIHGFWDDVVDDGPQWTQYTIDAIDQYGKDLLNSNTPDVDGFCPAYDDLDKHGRKNFWVKLVSAIAAAESDFHPNVPYKESFVNSSGESVISRGLMQLSKESANLYGCGINKEKELDDPQTNLECGVRILNHWIKHDGVISASHKGSWLGAARYWSVIRSDSKRYATMKQLIKQTKLCKKN